MASALQRAAQQLAKILGLVNAWIVLAELGDRPADQDRPLTSIEPLNLNALHLATLGSQRPADPGDDPDPGFLFLLRIFEVNAADAAVHVLEIAPGVEY